ncbi:MAG: aspartate carbamoyltransferase catalytic subunit [Terriglobales bacterium]
MMPTATLATGERKSAADWRPPTGSLLGIESLSRDEVLDYLNLAREMERRARERGSDLLRGQRIVLLFYEASTRTRVSFELAAKALGATTTVITSSASSIEKGESLIDTGYTLHALGADLIVMRHPSSGAHWTLARHLDIPLVNAGDGMHEHPSQALLDAYTILNHKPSLEGLRVTILGDIYHSRVARSDVFLLSKFGAEITLCGPPDLVPDIATALAPGVRVSRTLEDGMRDADVVMLLRIQKERFVGRRMSFEQYVADYQMTSERLRWARPDAIVMHPGPIIRGIELTSEVADSPRAVIREQVHNGIVVRMGILARGLGKA